MLRRVLAALVLGTASQDYGIVFGRTETRSAAALRWCEDS